MGNSTTVSKRLRPLNAKELAIVKSWKDEFARFATLKEGVLRVEEEVVPLMEPKKIEYFSPAILEAVISDGWKCFDDGKYMEAAQAFLTAIDLAKEEKDKIVQLFHYFYIRTRNLLEELHRSWKSDDEPLKTLRNIYKMLSKALEDRGVFPYVLNRAKRTIIYEINEGNEGGQTTYCDENIWRTVVPKAKTFEDRALFMPIIAGRVLISDFENPRILRIRGTLMYSSSLNDETTMECLLPTGMHANNYFYNLAIVLVKSDFPKEDSLKFSDHKALLMGFISRTNIIWLPKEQRVPLVSDKENKDQVE